MYVKLFRTFQLVFFCFSSLYSAFFRLICENKAPGRIVNQVKLCYHKYSVFHMENNGT